MTEALPLLGKITAQSQMKQKHRNLTAQFGDGYLQTAPDGLNSIIDSWELRFAPLEGADLTTMNRFLLLVGTTEWFIWAPFEEITEKKWLIESDSIAKTLVNTSTFIISFKIIQVFDLGAITPPTPPYFLAGDGSGFIAINNDKLTITG